MSIRGYRVWLTEILLAIEHARSALLSAPWPLDEDQTGALIELERLQVESLERLDHYDYETAKRTHTRA